MEPENTVVVGVLVRLDGRRYQSAVQSLKQIPGVSTFRVQESGSIGLLLETNSIEAAHTLLRNEVQAVPGVLAAWPVFLHAEQ